MARLPANTPVVVAGTARVDPQLQPDATPTRTIVVAELVPIGDPAEVAQVDEDGDMEEYPVLSPAVQLGAVIIDANTHHAPFITVPQPAQERAIEAIEHGEAAVALGTQVDLLNWMTDTLTTLSEPTEDEAPWEDDPDLIPHPIDDPQLRAALAVEANRLRHAADRLAALRARVAHHEAVLDVTDAAEDIVRRAAQYTDPDDEP